MQSQLLSWGLFEDLQLLDALLRKIGKRPVASQLCLLKQLIWLLTAVLPGILPDIYVSEVD